MAHVAAVAGFDTRFRRPAQRGSSAATAASTQILVCSWPLHSAASSCSGLNFLS